MGCGTSGAKGWLSADVCSLVAGNERRLTVAGIWGGWPREGDRFASAGKHEAGPFGARPVFVRDRWLSAR